MTLIKSWHVKRADGFGNRLMGLFHCDYCDNDYELTAEHPAGDRCRSCNNKHKRIPATRSVIDNPKIVYENLKIINGERIAGFKCSTCNVIYETGARNRITNYNCPTCVNAAKPNRKTNTSGYIGVSRSNGGRKNNPLDRWIGKITKSNSPIFNVVYKDSEYDYEYGKLWCALDREVYIIENNLPSKRNFTDNELLKYLKRN